MICPICKRELTERLDKFWLEHFGFCAKCDREGFSKSVMEGYLDETEKA